MHSWVVVGLSLEDGSKHATNQGTLEHPGQVLLQDQNQQSHHACSVHCAQCVNVCCLPLYTALNKWGVDRSPESSNAGHCGLYAQIYIYLGSNQVVQRFLLEEEDFLHHIHQHFDQKVTSDVDGDKDSNHDQPPPRFKVAIEVLTAGYTDNLDTAGYWSSSAGLLAISCG